MDHWDVMEFYDPFVTNIRACGFKYLGKGSFRQGYSRRGVVIKIPHTVDGVVDNIMEARGYKHHRNNPTDLGLYLAPCKLLPNFALMMFKVTTNIDWSAVQPEWVDMVDHAQVGYRKDRLVAYDYALDLTERWGWEEESLLKSEFFQGEWKRIHPHVYPAHALPPVEKEPVPSETFSGLVLDGQPVQKVGILEHSL